MNEIVTTLARALLYEGYVLYPYRASSVKNRHRFNFGCLHPVGASAHGEAENMQTECLVAGGSAARVRIVVRFLHLARRAGSDWQEAMEREVTLPARTTSELATESQRVHFAFAAAEDVHQEPIAGAVQVTSERVGANLWRIRVLIENLSEPEAASVDRRGYLALMRALVSTHTVLHVENGEFLSLLDPPTEAAAFAERCENRGTFPVLVGDPAVPDVMLSSPIILYDHPKIAAESPGDLFDGTEIDEILTLRILTLTEEEKREMRATDPRVAQLLERTEALGPADMVRLHGRLTRREPPALLRSAFRAGDSVRLRPSRRADVFDIALAGKRATVASVERDLDGAMLYAVTVDDDPGADLGATGLPGHRFFFHPEEVEPWA